MTDGRLPSEYCLGKQKKSQSSDGVCLFCPGTESWLNPRWAAFAGRLKLLFLFV